MALYSDIVMDHFVNPRNTGVIEQADGVGDFGSGTCGDVIKVYLKIENGVIRDAKFEACGCSVVIASGSMVTEMIKGMTPAQVLALSREDVVKALHGLPEHKLDCCGLAVRCVHAAAEDYKSRQ